MSSGPWGSLTVTTWGPQRTEPQMLRESYLFPESHRHLDDESLQAVIDGAKERIGGLRLSWTIVACNYLRDGTYHASRCRTRTTGCLPMSASPRKA